MPSNYQPLAAEQYDLDSLVRDTELSERPPNGASAPDVCYPVYTSHRRSSSFHPHSHSPKLSSDYADITVRKRIWWHNAIINCLFMGSWFIFATLLSLYNKWMFSPTKFGFPSPLFVTMIHMFVQWGLAYLLRIVKPETFRPARSPTWKDYGKRAVPTGVATSLDIGLSNLSLKTITLSFYTMCKSSSLVFVLLFAFMFRLESFSWRLVSVMFLIFVGVVLMVATETQFVFGGMILVLTASAFGGLRWALTQKLLVGKHGREMGMDSPASSVYWLAPSMGLSLAVLSMTIEGWVTLFRSKFFDGFETTLKTAMFVVTPGVVAFTMVMSEFYIIQRVGMVPMAVAGIFKEVTTITLSAQVFGDEITPVNMMGVGVTFIGIGLFAYHRYQKSVHSPTPLDAHGNPIAVEEYDTEEDVDAAEVEPLEVFDGQRETELEGRRIVGAS